VAHGAPERVQAVFDSGRLVAWHGYRQRVAGPGGGDVAKTSVLRRSVRDDVAKIGEYLGWHGAISFDYTFRRGREPALVHRLQPAFSRADECLFCRCQPRRHFGQGLSRRACRARGTWTGRHTQPHDTDGPHGQPSGRGLVLQSSAH
jgi:hypothetical protein